MEIPLLNIFLVLLVLAIIGYIIVYNIFIAAKQKVIEAWSDVNVQLKRRHDLIPNIVSTVKSYAKHEKDLLEKVTKERSHALDIDKNNLKELSKIENAI